MTAKVKSLAEFRAAHDKNFIIPERIRAGIKALGPEGWEYEGPFNQSCGVSVTDGSRFRGEFEKEYMVTVGKKNIYCGSPALAKKMRAML